MLKKGSKLYSILTGSCPRCQNSPMYVEKNPYKLSSLFKMHEKCSACGLKYKIEPSFFYGAMYVSYVLGVALGLFLFAVSFFLLGLGMIGTFLIISGILVLMLPVLARLSRNIWINFFVHYEKNHSGS